MIPLVAVNSLAFLAVTGGMASHVGGANWMTGAHRVFVWGAAAMAATAGVGALFGVAA